MAIPYVIPPVPGVKDIATLMEFLKSPQYPKYMEAMEAKRVELNGLIAKVAKASEIDAFHSQAAADRTQAAHELKKAHGEAAELVDDVREKMKSEEDNFRTRVSDWDKAKKSTQADLLKREKEVAAAERAATARETKLSRETEELGKLQGIVLAKQEELDKKLSLFRGTLEQVGA